VDHPFPHSYSAQHLSPHRVLSRPDPAPSPPPRLPLLLSLLSLQYRRSRAHPLARLATRRLVTTADASSMCSHTSPATSANSAYVAVALVVEAAVRPQRPHPPPLQVSSAVRARLRTCQPLLQKTENRNPAVARRNTPRAAAATIAPSVIENTANVERVTPARAATVVAVERSASVRGGNGADAARNEMSGGTERGTGREIVAGNIPERKMENGRATKQNADAEGLRADGEMKSWGVYYSSFFFFFFFFFWGGGGGGWLGGE